MKRQDQEIAALKAALAERESLAYGGLLAKLHKIQDVAGGRDVDVVDVLHSYALAVHDESQRRQEAKARIANLKTALADAIAHLEHAQPPPSHKGPCGLPNSCCDTLCMEAAHWSDMLARLKKALAS